MHKDCKIEKKNERTKVRKQLISKLTRKISELLIYRINRKLNKSINYERDSFTSYM